jgi:hypothetical protein
MSWFQIRKAGETNRCKNQKRGMARATIFRHVFASLDSYQPRLLQKNGNFVGVILAFSWELGLFSYFIQRYSLV